MWSTWTRQNKNPEIKRWDTLQIYFTIYFGIPTDTLYTDYFS